MKRWSAQIPHALQVLRLEIEALSETHVYGTIEAMPQESPAYQGRNASAQGAPIAPLAPAHLILGDEEFLAERIRNRITREITQGNPDVPVTRLRAGMVTAPELIELLSPSLFANDRVVVLTDFNDAGKEPAELVLNALVDPAPGVTMIIMHSGGGRTKSMVPKLKKLTQVHEVAALKPRDRPGWVNQEFRAHGVNVPPDVTHALLEGVGSDLRELASAVSQLVSDTNGNVTVEAVRQYYEGVAEVSGFDIADLAVAGRTARAVASTRRALQLGTSPVALSAALAMKIGTIARLYSTRGQVNSRQLAGELGMHPFVIEKTLSVARRWSGDAISKAVIVVAELDAQVKGRGGDPEYAIEAAVRRVAELAG